MPPRSNITSILSMDRKTPAGILWTTCSVTYRNVQRDSALHHFQTFLITIRFSFTKALCAREQSEAESSNSYYSNCRIMPRFGLLFFRTSVLGFGLICGACCCVLELRCVLSNRWLGDIKSLLSAGAGPGSGGGGLCSGCWQFGRVMSMTRNGSWARRDLILYRV